MANGMIVYPVRWWERFVFQVAFAILVPVSFGVVVSLGLLSLILNGCL